MAGRRLQEKISRLYQVKPLAHYYGRQMFFRIQTATHEMYGKAILMPCSADQ